MIATERLAALGTLAAGIAHEINNPLAIINEAAGYLTSLLEKQELSDMPRKAAFDKALQKILTSVDRARTITHQLLGTVRKSEPLLTEVDAAQLVNEALDLVQKNAKDKQMEVFMLKQHLHIVYFLEHSVITFFQLKLKDQCLVKMKIYKQH